MRINWKWPRKINKRGVSNGLRPWYQIMWAVLWAPLAYLSLGVFCTTVGLINLSARTARDVWFDNA